LETIASIGHGVKPTIYAIAASLLTAEARRAQREKKPATVTAIRKMGFMNTNDLTGKVIGAAIEVHATLGPGLLESAYEECLCHELKQRKLCFERQKSLPVEYKGVNLDCGYRLDVVVENLLVLELKACEKIDPSHKAQLLTYLKSVHKLSVSVCHSRSP
jgi:GxxExxY protein